MTFIDILILVFLCAGGLLGGTRGLISEITSILSWLLSFLCAKGFYEPFAPFLRDVIEMETFRFAASFVIIFSGVWLILAMTRSVLTSVLNRLGLGGANRLLGVFFGAGKALVLLLILTFIAGLLGLTQAEVWKQSSLTPHIEDLLNQVHPTVTQLFQEHLSLGREQHIELSTI